MDKFAAKAAPTVKGKIVGAALAAKSVNWKMKDAPKICVHLRTSAAKISGGQVSADSTAHRPTQVTV